MTTVGPKCCVTPTGNSATKSSLSAPHAINRSSAASARSAGGIGISLAGRTDLGTLAAVLAQSDLGLALHTGPMHIARAVGLPTVVLGMNWDPPLEWMDPPQPHVHLLRGREAPKYAEYRLDDLSPAMAITALTTLAEKYPPLAEALQKRIAESLSSEDHRAES